MDNGLLNQALNRFLFVPEADLAKVFLAVFLLLLIFGTWKAYRLYHHMKKLRETAEEFYEPQRDRVSPEAFLRKETERIAADEGMVEGIPDAFVSIGILATFIGLGVAIQEAANILNTGTAEQGQLERIVGLLGIIAFKFQTSVWGIFFSLVFKRCIVETYFNYRQASLDLVREALYAREREGVRTLLSKQNHLLQEQLDYNRQQDKKMAHAMEAWREEQASRSVQQLHDIQEQLQGFQDSISNFLVESQSIRRQILEELQSVKQRMDEYVQVTSDFTKTAKQFTDDTQAFGTHVSNFRGQVEQFDVHLTKVILDSWDKLTQTEKEIADDHYKTLLNIEKHVENINVDLLQTTPQYLEEVRRTFSEAFQVVLSETVSKAHQGYLDKAEEVQCKYNQVIASLDGTLNGINEKVADLSRKFLQEQQKLSEENQKAWADIEKVTEQSMAATEIHAKNVAELYHGMSGMLADMQEKNAQSSMRQENLLSGFGQSFQASLEAWKELHREESERRSHSLSEAIAQLKEIASAASDAQTNLSGSMGTLRQDTGEMLHHLKDSVVSVEQSASSSADLLREAMERNEQFLEQMADRLQVDNQKNIHQLHAMEREQQDRLDTFGKEFAEHAGNSVGAAMKSWLATHQEIQQEMSKMATLYTGAKDREAQDRERILESLDTAIQEFKIQTSQATPRREQLLADVIGAMGSCVSSIEALDATIREIHSQQEASSKKVSLIKMMPAP